MLNTFTCVFFGHRNFLGHIRFEKVLRDIVTDIVKTHEFVEFLVGRNGEFDQFASSVVKHIQKEGFSDNNSLVLVLPYESAEYKNNIEYYSKYYDEIEVCREASKAYFKAAIQVRNMKMADRADLIICYIERNSGGAYKAVEYAKKIGKKVINLAEIEDNYTDNY